MTVPGCRFCLENNLLDDAPLVRTDHFYLLGSRDPLLPQSVMVIPYAHFEDPFDITSEIWADMPTALTAAKDHLTHFAPKGYTLGWNVGPIGGQTQPHVHLHVIARHPQRGGIEEGVRGLVKAYIAAHPTAD